RRQNFRSVYALRKGLLLRSLVNWCSNIAVLNSSIHSLIHSFTHYSWPRTFSSTSPIFNSSILQFFNSSSPVRFRPVSRLGGFAFLLLKVLHLLVFHGLQDHPGLFFRHLHFFESLGGCRLLVFFLFFLVLG